MEKEFMVSFSCNDENNDIFNVLSTLMLQPATEVENLSLTQAS